MVIVRLSEEGFRPRGDYQVSTTRRKLDEGVSCDRFGMLEDMTSVICILRTKTLFDNAVCSARGPSCRLSEAKVPPRRKQYLASQKLVTRASSTKTMTSGVRLA